MEKEAQKQHPNGTISMAPRVYQAIAAITGELAKIGISKNRKSEMKDKEGKIKSSYNFRGIDDVYNALASLLAEHNLCVIPRVMSRHVTERTTSYGGVLFSVIVNVEFDFVSAEDGTSHTVVTCGEAMDSGDKATNKAMSAAYKYAALMTFCIPTEGDNDTENQTHEVAAKEPEKPKAEPGSFWTRAKLIIPIGLDKDGKPEHSGWATNFLAAVGKAPSREELEKLQADNQHILDQLESTKTFELNEACAKRAASFKP
jgi:hypothetical protein